MTPSVFLTIQSREIRLKIVGGGKKYYCARLQDQNLAANFFEAEPTTKICIQFLVYLTGTTSSIHEKEKMIIAVFVVPNLTVIKKQTNYLKIHI